MARTLIILALAGFFLAGMALDASARKGRLPRILPGGSGSSGTVVKVLDFPNIKALKRLDGRYIDLGYFHAKDGPGGWVGYIGSSVQYVPLDKHQLENLLVIAGVDKLPPVPQRSIFSGSTGFWLTITLVALIFGGALKLLRGVTSGASVAGRRIASVSGGLGGASGTATWDNVQDKMQKAAQRRRPVASIQNHKPKPPRHIKNPPPMQRGIARSPALATSSGFGRRGR